MARSGNRKEETVHWITSNTKETLVFIHGGKCVGVVCPLSLLPGVAHPRPYFNNIHKGNHFARNASRKESLYRKVKGGSFVLSLTCKILRYSDLWYFSLILVLNQLSRFNVYFSVLPRETKPTILFALWAKFKFSFALFLIYRKEII